MSRLAVLAALAATLISCTTSPSHFVESVVIGYYKNPQHGWHRGDGQEIDNPVESGPESLAEGGKLFGQLCAPCHGKTGVGDGPNAAELDPKPANLKELAGRRSDYHFYLQVSLGRDGMPIWREQLSETQRWHVVNYIQSLR